MNRKQRTYILLRRAGRTTHERLAQMLSCSPATARAILEDMTAAGLLRKSAHGHGYEIYFRQGMEYITLPCCGYIDTAWGPTTALDGAHVTIKENWPPPTQEFDFYATVTRNLDGGIATNRIHICNLHPLPYLLS